MTINLPNLSIDTTSIRDFFATTEQPFAAVEIPAGDTTYNEVITADALQTLWDTIQSRREWDNGEATWLIIFPTDEVAIVPGLDFPVEKWFPAWAKTCQLLAEVNRYTVDEYNIALRRIPLRLNR